MPRWPLAAVALALAACAPAPQSSAPPPPAEFLLAAGDSTFWVRSTGAGFRVRGAPLVLARYGGRFYEVYTIDDDHSFEDAVFLGERLYSRDLATDDSSLVLADSIVPRLAREYADANPDARPLGPDEDGPDDPPNSATATIDFLEIHGPYLSYEYELDTQSPDEGSWQGTRRGVVDLRASGSARLADIVGSTMAQRVLARARSAFRSTSDSIRLAHDDRARRAARALGAFRFDERSFALTAVGGKPAVAFDLPAGDSDAAGLTLPLPPIPLDTLPEWPEIRPTVPMLRDGTLQWARAGYSVVAHADSGSETAEIAIADSAGREWRIATVTGPVHRVFPLDRPSVSAEQRRALAHAFEEAALYDENVRTASVPRAPRPRGVVSVRARARRLIARRPSRRHAIHRNPTHA